MKADLLAVVSFKLDTVTFPYVDAGKTEAIPVEELRSVENEVADEVAEAGKSTAESTTRLPSYQEIRDTAAAPGAFARILCFSVV